MQTIFKAIKTKSFFILFFLNCLSITNDKPNIVITINRTQNPEQNPKIDIPNNNVVIELVDKAKVAYIVIASDGIENKEGFNKRIKDIFRDQNNLSSKEVINKALELSTDRDDRTMVVLKFLRNP